MAFPVFAPGDILNASDMNAVGLWRIGGGSFTTVASVSLPDNTFSSTYKNYRVLWVVTAVSTSLNFTMRMRASGSDNSASNYSNGGVGRTNGGSTFTMDSNNGTSWSLGGSDNGAQSPRMSLDFYEPQTTTKTFFSGTMISSAPSSGGFGGAVVGGFHNTATQFDSATLIASTGTITGYYVVYGYKD